MTKTIHEIKSDFETILNDILKINGLPIEQATSVAQVILQESGKFQRTEMLKEARLSNGNNNDKNNTPATFSQKRALRNLGIKYDNNISKSEASKLIEQAVQQLKSNSRRQ